MHVAGQEGDRVRGGAPLAAGHCHDHLEELVEPAVERRPVLEVDDPAQRLPGRHDPLPVAPLGHHLAHRLEVVQAGRKEEGQGGADEKVTHPTAHRLVHPGHLLGVKDGAGVGPQVAGGSGVDDHQRAVAQRAGVAPAVGLGVRVGPLGQGLEFGSDVQLARRPGGRVCGDQSPHLVLCELARREVADVLVDPVRRQTGDDPLLPPARRPHLLAPGPRGVPVVANVVVVEDHRRGHRGQHPADELVAPGDPVELAVLHEVLDLGAGRLGQVPPPGHERIQLGMWRGVGVDLVTQVQQQIWPLSPRVVT